MTTHDELLAEITNAIEDNDYDYSCAVISHTKLLTSLRAIVELHKPQYFDANEYSGTYCSNCTNMAAPSCYWPCPTIQAIDVELS